MRLEGRMCDEVKVAPNVEMSDELRIKILERDGFTCQRCGMGTPDVALHVVQISDGESADCMVTLCSDCAGVMHDAPGTITKQTALMRAWQMSITANMMSVADIVSDVINAMTGRTLNNNGKNQVMQLVQKFGIGTVCDATRTAFSQYPSSTDVEFEKAFGKIGGICYCMTHKTCRQCKSYVNGSCAKKLTRHRTTRTGVKINSWSIKDAETCGAFEER